MNPSEALQQSINRTRQVALVVGMAGVVVTLIGAFTNTGQFYQSYLQAFLLWSGIALGSLGILMIHHLVGGGWGFMARRILEAGVRTIPFVAILFIPIILGMDFLYHHWLHPEAHVELIEKKSLYLNRDFFIARSVAYFVIWIFFGFILCRLSCKQDQSGAAALNAPMRKWSGIGVVVYGLTATFAGWDWTMSLEPSWFSSMWGPLFFVGQGLTTFAFTVIVLAKFSGHEPISGVIKPVHFHDIGNLLFAFVILWTYMSFGQFIIIWSGNLPEEITWYLDRSTDGWKAVAVILTAFHFVLPFLLLLSRLTKLKGAYLAKIAVWILVMRLVDNYWVVAPTFQDGVRPHYLDLAAPIGMGGIWLALFLTFLAKKPLLAAHDPRFAGLITGKQDHE